MGGTGLFGVSGAAGGAGYMPVTQVSMQYGVPSELQCPHMRV
jgi:hypothetical protein